MIPSGWPPGSIVLDRYVIVRPLGRGGTARVFLARHRRTEQHVALKVLDDGVASNAEMVRRFWREARAIGKIHSDHVVKVFDFQSDTDGNFVMVMEFLEGESVHDILRRGPVSILRARDLGAQLLEGIAAAHAADVVHRDLKPANLLVTRSSAGAPERCKIVDFGVSKLRDASEQSLTVPGLIIGTLPYMAPEQTRTGGEVDRRTDLYAASVCLFAMITATRPIVEADAVQLLLAIGNRRPLTLREATGGVAFGDDLEFFFMRGLQKDPSQRFQSAEEMRDAWIAACDSVANAEELHRATIARRLTLGAVESTEDSVPPPEATGAPDVSPEPVAHAGRQQTMRDRTAEFRRARKGWRRLRRPSGSVRSAKVPWLAFVFVLTCVSALAMRFARGRSNEPPTRLQSGSLTTRDGLEPTTPAARPVIDPAARRDERRPVVAAAPAITPQPNVTAAAVQSAPAPEVSPRSVGSIVAEASRLGASGLFERARSVIRIAITRAPHDADVLSTAGMIELNAGRPAPAAEYFRDAIAQNARHVKSHFGLGEAMLDLGDRPAALDEYRACLRYGATGSVARESAQQVALLTR